MMMYIEKKTYEIECLSPVHVGNGRTLKAFEYLYDRKAQKVYFVDEGKWIAFLYRHKLIDDFSEYIRVISAAMGRKGPFRGEHVWEWLLKRGIPSAELQSLSATVSDVTTNNKLLDRGSLNDIARNVVTVDGMPYIPGSSIKGALRTGILYHVIKYEAKRYRKYWNELAHVMSTSCSAKDVKKTARKVAADIEKDVFQKLKISSDYKIPAAVQDSMRGLIVSDAHCIQQDHESVIVQKLDGTAKENKRNGQESALPIFRECIRPGTRLRCVISLDKRMMQEIGIFSIHDALEMTKEFIQDGIQMQKQVFGHTYEMEFAMAEDANIILGGGTGFLTKSILYALAPSAKEGREITAKYLDLAFPGRGREKHRSAHEHVRYDRNLSPRTVKLARVGMDTSIMGLCYMHEVESC